MKVEKLYQYYVKHFSKKVLPIGIEVFMIIVSNVEDHLRSVSINSSKSIKNPLGYNLPASKLYHRIKFIFLTKRVRILSMACILIWIF